MMIGTPQYMAPEQLEGGSADAPADMWALGATLYAAVEGIPPFEGPTLTAVIAAILTGTPPPPAACRAAEGAHRRAAGQGPRTSAPAR